jgi:hypothetical protein
MFSPRQLVTKYFPEATVFQVDNLLWNATSYPLCNLNRLEFQLQILASKGSVDNALIWAAKCSKARFKREMMHSC